ncbi:acyl dehydratase [Pikeienuella piscinae]|uniref:Acyl dehydratase n=1 Tax=Pikeienuella piscinae TaxID=2748098 RepID=A0A7L5BV05_9RHOB|nr:MaoC family dehydratase N-terminal domain-containing protein [Pikeienuella piscinae]QIE55161.1 acyl dehydratase [Pikeienuella piscinae]
MNFVTLTSMLEALFLDSEYRKTHSAISGRVAPGALVYAIAEWLTLNATAQGTGPTFLNMELNVNKPVLEGGTIHVEIEVTEIRSASKGGRGLVRTRNEVVNQRGEVVIIYTPLRPMARPEG